MPNPETVDLSVVIPAYNRAHCIARAVQSVIEQAHDGLEIIVVDDGSSDDIGDQLAAFGSELRLIRHDTNLGASAARNTGIRAARGRYVAFLDSDDLWRPGKLSRQLAFMALNHMRASCTGFSAITRDSSRPVNARRPYPTTIGLEEIVWGCYVSPGSTLVAERRLLLELGGYDAIFPRLEDWDLLLRLTLAEEPLGYLDEALAILHPAGPSSLEKVRTSINFLRTKLYAQLAARSSRLARQFEAALNFELASAARLHHHWFSFVRHLTLSFFYAPRNQSFNIVVWSRFFPGRPPKSEQSTRA